MKASRVGRRSSLELIRLGALPVPQPKANEAVVKVAAAGANSIDAPSRDGSYKMPLPFVPGQEGAGVIIAIGAGVKSVKVGDRVAWSGTLGSYSEYVAGSAESLVPVPAAV